MPSAALSALPAAADAAVLPFARVVRVCPVVAFHRSSCWCCISCAFQVVERPPGESWADEFGAGSNGAAAASNWSSEFMQQQAPPRTRDWADEFAAGVANINLEDGATEEQLEAAWAAMGEDVCTQTTAACSTG